MKAMMHQPCKTFPARYTLLAITSEESTKAADIQAAKDYIKDNNLTSEDVKIVPDTGCILVVTKREVTFSEKT